MKGVEAVRWWYTLGRIAGTQVRVHATFLLLLAWAAYTGYRAAGAAAALSETLFFVCFFLCILLHEFGHIRMAARFGSSAYPRSHARSSSSRWQVRP